MSKKLQPKISPTNFFAVVGRPFFYLFIYLLTTAFLFFSLLKRTLGKFTNQKFPHFAFHYSLPTVNLPKITLKKLPNIRFKLISIPKILPTSLSNSKIPYKFLSICLIIYIFSLAFYLSILHNLPNPKDLEKYPSILTTTILDRNGKLLYKIYKDENRTLIHLQDLPPIVKNAFLAAEDKDFYHHKGFSILGLIRAFYNNLTHERLEGGSTITQQLIKNTLLSSERTITRKIKELLLAVMVENLYSKDKIFEMYLNQVGFGGTAYGVQEASQQYFNIDAKDLNLSQAAFLAGLPQAPSKYSPFSNNNQIYQSRQQLVLYQMYKAGMISNQELSNAIHTPISFKANKTSIQAPHFVMYIKDLLSNQLGENLVQQGGLIVTTTLDLDLQKQAETIVSQEISTLKNFHVTNGAALITNPQNGEILAMVGSKDYFDFQNDGQVNLTLSLRQPGSSIKPINYALGFENGLTPTNLIDDKPVSIKLPNQAPWIPKNYDGKFHGTISLRQALASSYNIPSIELLLQNGIANFVNFAQNLGITSWHNVCSFVPSIALGSLETKMTDLATAYSTFANNGQTTPLKSILKIEKPDGTKISLASCSSKEIGDNSLSSANAQETSCLSKFTISPLTAFYITDILSDNQARSPAFGFNSVLNIKNAKVAVKTGTSNEMKDNWAIGYTKNYLVATWVGNNDNSPMSQIASGITGASPIWSKIFNKIIEKNPQPNEIEIPSGIIKIPICTLTNTLSCNGCPTKYEYFPISKAPTSHCDSEKIKQILSPTPPKI